MVSYTMLCTISYLTIHVSDFHYQKQGYIANIAVHGAILFLGGLCLKGKFLGVVLMSHISIKALQKYSQIAF